MEMYPASCVTAGGEKYIPQNLSIISPLSFLISHILSFYLVSSLLFRHFFLIYITMKFTNVDTSHALRTPN